MKTEHAIDWSKTAAEINDDYERMAIQRDELLSKVAAWEQKAANWVASPEAAQRLNGYRDLSQRLNVAEMQRDELMAALETAEMAMLGYTHRNDVITNALSVARNTIASVKGQP